MIGEVFSLCHVIVEQLSKVIPVALWKMILVLETTLAGALSQIFEEYRGNSNFKECERRCLLLLIHWGGGWDSRLRRIHAPLSNVWIRRPS